MHKWFPVLAVFASFLACGFAQAADQKNGPKPLPSGTTRVAVINLGAVFTKYDKANDFKAEITRSVKDLQEEAKRLQADLATWQNALQKNEFKNGTREEFEEKLINGRRRLEDLGRMATQTVGKTQQANLESLWNDVQDALKVYSAEHKIGLVIAYGDPVQKDQLSTFMNLDRKMRAADSGAGVPIYMGAGTDISEAIVDLLNQRYRDARKEAAGDID